MLSGGATSEPKPPNQGPSYHRMLKSSGAMLKNKQYAKQQLCSVTTPHKTLRISLNQFQVCTVMFIIN